MLFFSTILENKYKSKDDSLPINSEEVFEKTVDMFKDRIW